MSPMRVRSWPSASRTFATRGWWATSFMSAAASRRIPPVMAKYSLGFDFGTESCRVIVVDIKDGRIAGQATSDYQHGVIDESLPSGGGKLPVDYALQHPQDWLDSL